MYASQAHTHTYIHPNTKRTKTEIEKNGTVAAAAKKEFHLSCCSVVFVFSSCCCFCFFLSYFFAFPLFLFSPFIRFGRHIRFHIHIALTHTLYIIHLDNMYIGCVQMSETVFSSSFLVFFLLLYFALAQF